MADFLHRKKITQQISIGCFKGPIWQRKHLAIPLDSDNVEITFMSSFADYYSFFRHKINPYHYLGFDKHHLKQAPFFQSAVYLPMIEFSQKRPN